MKMHISGDQKIHASERTFFYDLGSRVIVILGVFSVFSSFFNPEMKDEIFDYFTKLFFNNHEL